MQLGSVDIILPIYKPNKSVFQAIDSVLSQTYEEYILYIVDDASKGNFLKDIQNHYGNNWKIRYLTLDKNSRQAFARNFAIEQGDSEFIAFIDQDDVWLKNKLEIQIEYIQKKKKDALHGNLEFIDVQGNVILHEESKIENRSRSIILWEENSNRDISNMILKKPNLRIISSLIRRSIFESIGGFKAQLFGGEDELFWYEISRTGNIGYINQLLFQRRIHDSNAVKVFRSERFLGYYNAVNYIKLNHTDFDQEIIQMKHNEIAYNFLKISLKEKKIFMFFQSILIVLRNHKLFCIKKILSLIFNYRKIT